jgi:predicted Zn-dependent peptidase
MKIKSRKKKNPSKPIQGLLLLSELSNKYDEQEKANTLLKELNKVFASKGSRLSLSTSKDEIYYFTEHLKQALKILKEA